MSKDQPASNFDGQGWITTWDRRKFLSSVTGVFRLFGSYGLVFASSLAAQMSVSLSYERSHQGRKECKEVLAIRGVLARSKRNKGLAKRSQSSNENEKPKWISSGKFCDLAVIHKLKVDLWRWKPVPSESLFQLQGSPPKILQMQKTPSVKKSGISDSWIFSQTKPLETTRHKVLFQCFSISIVSIKHQPIKHLRSSTLPWLDKQTRHLLPLKLLHWKELEWPSTWAKNTSCYPQLLRSLSRKKSSWIQVAFAMHASSSGHFEVQNALQTLKWTFTNQTPSGKAWAPPPYRVSKGFVTSRLAFPRDVLSICRA